MLKVKICNRGCYRPAGCQVHWNSPKRVPCKECGKLTFSKYGACDIHARKYRKMEQYYRKKLKQITQNVSESNTTAKENAHSAHVSDE